MEQHDGHVHVTEEEASGGSKEGVVRWVLLVGILLAIGLLTIVWVTGALTQGAVESEGDVSGQIQAMEKSEEAAAAPAPATAAPASTATATAAPTAAAN